MRIRSTRNILGLTVVFVLSAATRQWAEPVENIPPFDTPNSQWGTEFAASARATARLGHRFRIGNTEIMPYIGGGYSYDDNIYWNSAEQPATSDHIFTFAPGILAKIGNNDYSLLADYSHEWHRYSENEQENYQADRFVLSGIYRSPKTIFTLADAYTVTRRDVLEAGAMLDETRNIVLGDIEHAYSQKSSVALNGTYETVDYDPYVYGDVLYQPIDYEEIRVGARPYYRAFAKTDLFGEYAVGWVTPDAPSGTDASDATYQEVSVGFRGRFTGKTTGIGSVGYQHRTFESEEIEDINEWVARLGLRTTFSQRFRGGIVLASEIDPSISREGYSVQTSRVEPFLSRELWYDDLTGTISGAYELADYHAPSGEMEDRQDQFWEVAGILDWHPGSYVSLGVGYSYSEYKPDPGETAERRKILVRASASY